ASGIDDSGRLVVQTAAGVTALNAGEVHLGGCGEKPTAGGT
ncbi:MAG: hypothetical protein DLM63_00555, partial [Solirubrobacterales bacterium]